MSLVCVDIGLESWLCKNMGLLSLDLIIFGGILIILSIFMKMIRGKR